MLGVNILNNECIDKEHINNTEQYDVSAGE